MVLMGVVLPVAGWGQADTKPSDAKPAGEQAATVEKVPEAEKALTAEKTEGLTERQREIAEGNARLLKLAADLRKAGYVRSVKGAQGGYLLAMEPSGIGLAPLITLLEGDIRLTDEAQAPASRVEQCLNDALFEKLNRTVADYLGGHTLQNLVDEYRHRLDAGMYYL